MKIEIRSRELQGLTDRVCSELLSYLNNPKSQFLGINLAQTCVIEPVRDQQGLSHGFYQASFGGVTISEEILIFVSGEYILISIIGPITNH